MIANIKIDTKMKAVVMNRNILKPKRRKKLIVETNKSPHFVFEVIKHSIQRYIKRAFVYITYLSNDFYLKLKCSMNKRDKLNDRKKIAECIFNLDFNKINILKQYSQMRRSNKRKSYFSFSIFVYFVIL